MRVLLINKFWKPVGGVEEYCAYLLKLLEEEGHEVLPFGMEDPDNVTRLPAGQSVSPVSFQSKNPRERIRAAGRACFGYATRRAIGHLVATQKIDVAHVVHAYHQLGMTFLPILRRAGIPVIMDLHDYKAGCSRYLFFNDVTERECTLCIDRPHAWMWAPTATGCWNGSRLSGALLTAETLSARAAGAYTRADVVIIRNALQARALEEIGVPRRKVRCIPHWAEPSLEPIPQNGEWVLYVGRLSKEKGPHVLLKAAIASGMKVRFAGEGAMRPELERMAANANAQVEFLGWQSHASVERLLRDAMVLVVPSICPEIFGLVICEAFSAGLPVIGSDIGGIGGLLSNGRGYLVPAGDPNELAARLRYVQRNPEEALGAAKKAREYAANELSYELWRRRYQSIYNELGLQGASERSMLGAEGTDTQDA